MTDEKWIIGYKKPTGLAYESPAFGWDMSTKQESLYSVDKAVECSLLYLSVFLLELQRYKIKRRKLGKWKRRKNAKNVEIKTFGRFVPAPCIIR